MSDSGQLKQSDRWCERMCRRSKSSFFASFALLDAPRRTAMCALYAFARVTDDIGDSTEPADVRRANLQNWRSELFSQVHSAMKEPSTPVQLVDTQRCALLSENELLWPALVGSVLRFQIPIELLNAIIDGVAMDIDYRHMQTWDELDKYCYHVASAVGLACTHIWSVPGSSPPQDIPREGAIDCGIAFQLTNILRDIAEDARMGRIYLPLEALEQFEIDPAQWLCGRPNGNWRGLLEHTAQRAQQLYTSGWPTIHSLTPQSQRMFSLMWRSYRGLLEQVVAQKDQLWVGRKIRLRKRQRLSLFTSHFISPVYLRLPAP